MTILQIPHAPLHLVGNVGTLVEVQLIHFLSPFNDASVGNDYNEGQVTRKGSVRNWEGG